MKRLLVIGVTGILVASAFAQSGRVRLEARMSGIAKGKAKWQTRDSSTQFQAELEVEGERLRRATSYWVTVGSNPAFQVTTNSLGRFNMARRYTSAERPSVEVGDRVTVRSADGATVLTGTFVRIR